MEPFIVQPGARVLWCLRRRATDVRCVLMESRVPVEVQVLQDRDVILRETFPDQPLAEQWAAAFGARLRDQGWADVP